MSSINAGGLSRPACQNEIFSVHTYDILPMRSLRSGLRRFELSFISFKSGLLDTRGRTFVGNEIPYFGDILFGPISNVIFVLAEKHGRIRGGLRIYRGVERVRILLVDPDRRQERVGEVVERDRG